LARRPHKNISKELVPLFAEYHKDSRKRMKHAYKTTPSRYVSERPRRHSEARQLTKQLHTKHDHLHLPTRRQFQQKGWDFITK